VGGIMSEVDYIISLHPSKFDGYQSKKGNKGEIKAFISNLWKMAMEDSIKMSKKPFDLFIIHLNFVFTIERYCLERAFQKIKIKGGMCKPCCVFSFASNTIEYLFGLYFDVIS